jgi:hypothetical protein
LLWVRPISIRSPDVSRGFSFPKKPREEDGAASAARID